MIKHRHETFFVSAFFQTIFKIGVLLVYTP